MQWNSGLSTSEGEPLPIHEFLIPHCCHDYKTILHVINVKHQYQYHNQLYDTDVHVLSPVDVITLCIMA